MFLKIFVRRPTYGSLITFFHYQVEDKKFLNFVSQIFGPNAPHPLIEMGLYYSSFDFISSLKEALFSVIEFISEAALLNFDMVLLMSSYKVYINKSPFSSGVPSLAKPGPGKG